MQGLKVTFLTLNLKCLLMCASLAKFTLLCEWVKAGVTFARPDFKVETLEGRHID